MSTICPMTSQHYAQVVALWQKAEGVGLSAADSPEGQAAFLERNPELSWVVLEGGQLVGAVLCGHDGRRGYIHHLAVDPNYRRRGLGRALVERCLTSLSEAGIDKCHLFVFGANQGALAFWQASGWAERVELKLFSKHTTNS